MSKLFKAQAAYLTQENKKFTPNLEKLSIIPEGGCIAAWRSNRFLVQLYEEGDFAQRISINRTMVDHVTGRWIDGITWQEIQDIKRQIGFGDKDAVEVYPKDNDVVNVANMRHIWLVESVPFAWRKKV